MFHRLSIRLMVTIGLLTALIFIAVSYVTWQMHSERLQAEVIRNAATLSETIRLSLRDQMLANRRDEVEAVIWQIGNHNGIEKIRIFNKSGIVLSTDMKEVNTTVDLNTEACYICHVDRTPRVVLANPERTRIYTAPGGYRILGMITPIRNEPDCSDAPCHAHAPETNILGVLDVNLSLQVTDRSLEDEARKYWLVGVLGCLLIVVATGISLWKLVYQPIDHLMIGTKQLSAGNLEHLVPDQSTDEFAALAHSFNKMTADLRAARDEVTTWNRTLEQRVREKTRELEQTRDRIVQTEKMASLGKLAAVVAHEVNNPIAGILTYIKLLRKMLNKGAEHFRPDKADQYLGMMETETVRVGDIVRNLLAFSRPSQPNVNEADINTIIERSLQLVAHQLDLQNVERQATLEPNIPPIKADPAQVQQMLLAILINAVEAMPDGGRLHVRSAYDAAKRQARIEVSDTGVGIPEEDLPHLFEPFYTTKTEGKGVGLGLFVVYGIVRRHGGSIDVQSEINRGTTFTITLPQDGPPPEEAQVARAQSAAEEPNAATVN